MVNVDMFNCKLNGFVIFLCFLLFSCPCLALFSSTPHHFCFDTTSNISSSFVINRDKLLDSLSANLSIPDGFYTATWGENSTSVYGLLQCRGGISAQSCSTCVKSIVKKSIKCANSTDSAYMLRNCFLRYSIKNFTGESESLYTAATFKNLSEDPSVASQGNNFMRKLVSSAPSQRLMFNEGILHVGQKGKRGGFAQCTRDLNISFCDKCFKNLLDKYIRKVGGMRTWVFSSLYCIISYEDLNAKLNHEASSTGKFTTKKFMFL
ncbi:Hypothetical predicted protein [Olea europaea subsp. europaea]|uniref:Gnk2-homologous domain-containing protein n=1 Tax=Olea europaea subsp. europaea TaxID=158383 RepID=A0A8S0SFG9_OLEEU|nr:Hypothetical predicted protein [Olea europaea subsp. europaea]